MMPVANDKPSLVSDCLAKKEAAVRNKKRVRFASSIEYLEVKEALDGKCKNEIWWSLVEMKMMASNAACNGTNNKNKIHLTDCLDRAWLRCKQRASCRESKELRNDQAPHVADDQDLRQWCRFNSTRGLERRSSRLHQTGRAIIVKAARKHVVALSQRTSDPERIRCVYEQISRPSVLFATMMGAADASTAVEHIPLRHPHLSNGTSECAMFPTQFFTVNRNVVAVI